MEKLQNKKSYRDIYLYILLIFMISFGTFAGFYILGTIFQFLSNEIIYIFTLIYMFLPTLTTIIVQKFIKREKIFKNLALRIGKVSYYFIAIIICFILVFLALLIALSFPGVEYDKNLENLQQIAELPEALLTLPDPAKIYIITSIPNAIILGSTVNTFFAFGEELGWRGFMVRSLYERKFGFWKTSFLIGVVWGFWHAPLIIFFSHNYPEHPIEGIFMMVGFTVLLSPILIYLRIKSESVLVPSVFHGVINALSGISIILKGGNDLLNTVAGLSGFIASTILIIIIANIDNYILKNPIIKPKVESHVY